MYMYIIITLYRAREVNNTVYVKIFARKNSFCKFCQCMLLAKNVFGEFYVSVDPLTTSWKVHVHVHVPCKVGKIKFSEIFVTIQSMSHW